MPLYEYQCKECSHKFEELISNSSAQVKCPKCKTENVVKLFSSFSAAVNSGSGSMPCGARSSSGCGSGFS